MIQQLLKTVADIHKKHDVIACATGSNFNVFDVLDSTKELDICRFMYTLLNPQGSHGQGAVFLEAFFDTVLTEINIDKSELHKASVTREHQIEGMRRIDIYIETSSWAIPIEVKQFAVDQKSQCYDYMEYAKSRNKSNYRLYYLTPELREPSEESLTNNEQSLDKTKLSFITFEKDILRWLELCVSQHALRLAPIREVLLQYMAVIRKFTNKPEDNVMKEIALKIMSSAESIKSATDIAGSLDQCRCEIMRKLFIEIENQIPNKLINEYDWNYRCKNAKCVVDNYPKGYNYPGISYHLKDFTVKGKNISVWVRCEIDGNPSGCLFVGLCVSVDGAICDNKSELFNKADLIKHGIQEPKECEHENFTFEWANPNWWLYWDFITAQNGEKINFRDKNTAAYYSLFDKSGFECVVQNCVKAIKKFLLRR